MKMMCCISLRTQCCFVIHHERKCQDLNIQQKTNRIGAFKPSRSVEQIDLKTNEAFECVDNTFEQTDVETIDVRDRFVGEKTICGICI